MPPRHLHAVAGDSDEAHEAGIAGLHRGSQRAIFAERGLPLRLVDQVVELDEIDVVHFEPPERRTDLVARFRVRALPGLRREEETVAPLAREPLRDVELRVAVARGGVQMVEVVPENERERAVGLRFGHARERRAAEKRPAAFVTGLPEGRARDHRATIGAFARADARGEALRRGRRRAGGAAARVCPPAGRRPRPRCQRACPARARRGRHVRSPAPRTV